MEFSIGSELWLAIDDYCVGTECDCREVVLQFVSRKDVQDARQLLMNLPAPYYNYRNKTYRQAQAPSLDQPSLNALLSGLKAQRPELDAEMRKRHRRMKALFKRALS